METGIARTTSHESQSHTTAAVVTTPYNTDNVNNAPITTVISIEDMTSSVEYHFTDIDSDDNYDDDDDDRARRGRAPKSLQGVWYMGKCCCLCVSVSSCVIICVLVVLFVKINI
eukprot:Tbor_TRINITY_DN4584_c0_g1::TRINITY_DN4584_c0_g1_i2::g.15791::m.15791